MRYAEGVEVWVRGVGWEGEGEEREDEGVEAGVVGAG